MRRDPRGRRAPRPSRARPRIQGRELTELAVIERAIQRTRKNAAIQLAVGVTFGSLILAFPGSWPGLAYGLVAFNAIAGAYLARRLYRLRRSGPVVRALLEAPAEVTQIHQWPPKLPPRRLPAMLDIETKDGAKGSLLLDAKAPADSAALVATLRTRSPDAVVVYPAASVA